MQKQNFIRITLALFMGALALMLVSISSIHAQFNNSRNTDSPYSKDFGLEEGLKDVKEATNGTLSEKPIVEYIQDIVIYLLGFISVIAVIYIIYGGFRLVTSAGDEEQMKKTRNIITYVIAGILVMWLAYPIVHFVIKFLDDGVAYQFAIPSIHANNTIDTQSNRDTFVAYRDNIRKDLSKLENEYRVNRSVSVSTISALKSTIQGAFDRLPDSGEYGIINQEAKQLVDSYLDLAIKNPNDSNHINNAISRVTNFVERAKISSITGDIGSSSTEDHAPATISFRANNIKDPSGVALNDNNYIWWIKESGGTRRELQRGPNFAYTFTKEGNYTVFLDVISSSSNSKGKVDILPLSTSKAITVKPKMGEIVLMVNGVNVSNMETLKISPAIGAMGLIFDATASRATNGTIMETTWDFGNNEESKYSGPPVIERQLYAISKIDGYIMNLSVKTNNGQTFNKKLRIMIAEPAATIQLEKEIGNIGEDISMSAVNHFNDSRNVLYTWKIQDTSGKKVLKDSEGMNFRYKFEALGEYIITLTTKGADGKSDIDSKRIKIESREPIVSIDTPKPISSDRPNTIVFDASKSYDPDTNSRRNLTYTWSIDGERVTLDNIENNGARGTYTLDSKGGHTVSLTVANPQGKITIIEQQFEVKSLLAVNIINTAKVTTRGTPLTLIGQTNQAEYYEWNMGDGSPTITGIDRIIQHTYQKSGVYNVTLRVSRIADTETNSITRKVYITDTDTPMAMINMSNGSSSIIEEKGACNGIDAYVVNRSETTNLSSENSVNIDGSNNELSYTWKYFGKVRTTNNISEKFNELGCFPIELTVRSNKNGATHTATQYIKLVNYAPTLTSLTTNIDPNKKDNQKVLVRVKANGATDTDGVITSYIWYYTTDSDTEPQSVQITNKNEMTFVLPNITEKYYFGVILEDNDGGRINSSESGQGSVPLIIDNSNGNVNLPLITLTVPKVNVNVGEAVEFSAEARTIIPGQDISKKVEYSWDWDGDGRIDQQGRESRVSHVYARSGDYNMKIRVTNNGVSNTKYQMIHVRNKLEASAKAYRLPDGKIYFLNTSQGSYSDATWTIDEMEYDGIRSLMIDNPNVSKAILKIISDTNEESSINIDLSKIETVAGSGVLYQSYPHAINDVITLKNPTDVLSISLYGNSGSSYLIDTNTNIDNNLDGVGNNDADNQNDTSYTDGSLYVIRGLSDTHKREHTMRLMIMEGNTIVASRDINVILDYIATESATKGSGTLINNMGENDQKRITELVEIIRELTDSADRTILMQQYNVVVENWNNPQEKISGLIKIQTYVDDSKTIDVDTGNKISSLIDQIVTNDFNATNAIDVSISAIRQLIPQNSQNYDTLMGQLAEIGSHPESLDLNKEIARTMWKTIEKDTTIKDDYKNYIKTQLETIVHLGAQNASIDNSQKDKKTVTDGSDAGSSILNFISGFVKIFFIIIGVILLVGILAFVFYRISRKDDNIGFQDFLIDSVFHSKSSKVVVATPTVKPVMPTIDPLTNYTPPSSYVESIAPNTSINDPIAGVSKNTLDTHEMPENHTTTSSMVPEAIPNEVVIPSWLKAPSTNIVDNASPSVVPPAVAIQNTTENTVTEISPKESTIDPIADIKTEEVVIPSWMQSVNTVTEMSPKESTIDPIADIKTEEVVIPSWMQSVNTEANTVTEISQVSETMTAPIGTIPEIIEKTSDPLMTSNQIDPFAIMTPDITPIEKNMDSSTIFENIIEKTPMQSSVNIAPVPTSHDLPDWLKESIKDTPIGIDIDDSEAQESSNVSEKISQSTKKIPKKKEVSSTTKKNKINNENSVESDNTTSSSAELPDWLK